MEYYDDNYGHWHDTNDPDTQEFYRYVQQTSVWKKCTGCGRKVKLRPNYDVCNSCADKREQGFDI